MGAQITQCRLQYELYGYIMSPPTGVKHNSDVINQNRLDRSTTNIKFVLCPTLILIRHHLGLCVGVGLETGESPQVT